MQGQEVGASIGSLIAIEYSNPYSARKWESEGLIRRLVAKRNRLRRRDRIARLDRIISLAIRRRNRQTRKAIEYFKSERQRLGI
jgi:hypothetical protein